MNLGTFINELKHNSTNLYIDKEDETELYGNETIFIGTKGVLINNINYQKIWKNCRIIAIEPEEETLPFPTFSILIQEI